MSSRNPGLRVQAWKRLRRSTPELAFDASKHWSHVFTTFNVVALVPVAIATALKKNAELVWGIWRCDRNRRASRAATKNRRLVVESASASRKMSRPLMASPVVDVAAAYVARGTSARRFWHGSCSPSGHDPILHALSSGSFFRSARRRGRHIGGRGGDGRDDGGNARSAAGRPSGAHATAPHRGTCAHALRPPRSHRKEDEQGPEPGRAPRLWCQPRCHLCTGSRARGEAPPRVSVPDHRAAFRPRHLGRQLRRLDPQSGHHAATIPRPYGSSDLDGSRPRRLRRDIGDATAAFRDAWLGRTRVRAPTSQSLTVSPPPASRTRRPRLLVSTRFGSAPRRRCLRTSTSRRRCSRASSACLRKRAWRVEWIGTG